MISKIAEKLKNEVYRGQFVAAEIDIGIPFQIRGMMKARGWTQTDLAQKSKMLQPRISALLSPGKIRPNVETLRRLAAAFDCALQIQFAPFSLLVKSQEDFDPESFNVPSFEAELANGIFDLEKSGEFMPVGNQIAAQQDAPMNVKTSRAFGCLACSGRSTRTKSADRRARRKIHRPSVSGRTWKVSNEAELLHLRPAVPNEATI